MLHTFTSPFDATAVRLLREHGADIVGKTNCDEFGMGSLNVHSVHGPVVNPYAAEKGFEPWECMEKRSAGGSSGGSAAAVVLDLCYAALGTDTGGSIRLPASYCGVAGFKPSYGLVSRWGVVPYADSLDCVGVLAADVQRVMNVYDVIAAHDPRDPTSAPEDARVAAREQTAMRASRWKQNDVSSLKGLRVGIPQEYFPAEITPAALEHFRRVVASLKKRGATIIPVSLPSTRYALSAYYVIATAEASSNLARYDGMQYGKRVPPAPGTDTSKISSIYAQTRSAGFGREVQRRILLGTYALSADAFDNYFLQAQRVRRLVQDDFDRVFALPNLSPVAEPRTLEGQELRPTEQAAGVDVLLHLSAVRTAPRLDEKADGLDAYVQDVLTVPASLAGLPALNVNVSMPGQEWPVGVSVVGQWGSDDLILDVGGTIQRTYESG